MRKYNLMSVVKLKTGKKKLRITLFNVETQKENNIEVGQRGAKDYTLYYAEEGKEKADERKRLYIERHKDKEDWTASGVNTNGFWAYHLLWSEPTLQKALNKVKRIYFS